MDSRSVVFSLILSAATAGCHSAAAIDGDASQVDAHDAELPIGDAARLDGKTLDAFPGDTSPPDLGSDATADAAILDASDAGSTDASDGSIDAADAGLILPSCALEDYAIPGTAMFVAAGPDGQLWFSSPDNVGRVLPRAADGGQGPAAILVSGSALAWDYLTAGPDGQMWIDETLGIDRFLTANGGNHRVVQGGTGIARGPAQTLWFNGGGGSELGRMTFSQSDAGVWSWSTSTVAYASAGMIAGGPDDAVWVASTGAGGGVARAATIDGGIGIQQFPTPFIMTLAAGPDGRIWFVDDSGKVGRIDARADAGMLGAVDGVAAPGFGNPTFMTMGPDEAMWFSDFNAHRIVRITPAGVVSGCALPASMFSLGITTGPDARIWFAVSRGHIEALNSLESTDGGTAGNG